MNQLVQLIKNGFYILVFFVFSNSLGQNKDIGVFTSADISYKCLGSDKYEVTLKVYVECGYDNGVLENSDNFPITIESKSQQVKFVRNVLKPENGPDRNGEKIYIFCPLQGSKCDGKTNRGLKLFKYSAIIDLAPYKKASDWKIFWARNNKSAEILTIEAKQPYHTEVIINNLTACSSTPNTDVDPVFGIKKGEAKTIQLAAVDPDGNRLKYSIVPPLQALNVPINYKSGISATQPFGEGKSVTIDNNSGELILPAIDQAGVNANFDVLIEEFNDGGTKVGESRKGFQVTTLETENIAPVISGINNTEETEITICAGQTLNFQIKGSDADGDKMKFIFRPTVSPNKNINFSGSFSHSTSPFLNFNWVTTSLDTGTFVVTVILEDDACPVYLTTSKEFTIRVNPIPTFDLGVSEPFNCGNPQVLSPQISNAVGNLSYEWASWFIHPLTGDTVITTTESMNTTLAIEEPRTVTLLVSDDAGCARRDYTSFWESLGGSMSFTRRCIGQTTSFTDASTYTGSTFKSRKWTIETKTAVTTAATFDHTFPGLGGYAAELIVEDNLGCIDTVAETVYIVDQPIHGLALEDSCSIFLELDPTVEENRSGVDLIDETIYYAPGDGRGVITWTINTLSGDFIGQVDIPSSEPEQRFPDRYLDFAFPDSGIYIIKTETNTSATCVATNFDTVHIVQRPKLKLLSDSVYSINCANPSTVFQVTLDDYYTGTSGYDFWYFNPDSVKSEITSFNDPKTILQITTDTTLGTYTYWVKDSKGCEHFQSVEVIFSTDAGLGYELQCSEGEIQFRDLSTVDTTDRTIVDWKWEFSDGTFSDLQEPTHLYSTQGIHTAVLTVTDSKGCTNSDTLDVYYSFPVSNLKVLQPNLDTIQLCANNKINLENDLNAKFDSQFNINKIKWSYIYANGRADSAVFTDVKLTGETLWKVQNYQLKDTTTKLIIKHEFTFNGNPDNITAAGEVCYSLDTLNKPLKIFPKFNGGIVDNRVCIGDSGIFKFFRDPATDTINIVSALWVFSNRQTGVEVGRTTDREPSVYIDKNDFTNIDQQLSVRISLMDINQCLYDTVKYVNVQEVTAKPDWDFDKVVCKGQEVLFTITSQQGDVDSWQINQNYEDSLASGKFIAPKFDYDVIGSQSIPFDKEGITPISLFLIKITSVQSGKICRARIDDFIQVNDVPAYNIQWDTVCSGVSQTTFFNNSTINGDFGKVIDYRWDFGDGTEQVITPAGQIEVKHRYNEGGNYTVKVTATTAEQCNRSDTTFQIYVRPTPIAKYETDKQFLEAHDIITFTDVSELYGATEDSIFWDFGTPGKFYNETEVTVQWDTVGIYYVYHYITTKDGCEDDTLYRIDLNTYLDLPNAFSPNGDGVNDELFLIYKSIYTLFDYKIFNRWGQVVFDSEGDLNKSWDGKFNGADQEVGVYVAHVKAEGAYNTQFNFKVNVRLIR